MPIERFLFDTVEGRPVEGFTLSAGGLEATIVAHGARLPTWGGGALHLHLAFYRCKLSDDRVAWFKRVSARGGEGPHQAQKNTTNQPVTQGFLSRCRPVGRFFRSPS